MKNILKYSAAVVAMLASFAACEEFEDHTVTVDGAPTLAYVNAGEDNLFSTLISHRPIGSTGSFSTEFAVQCNTPIHGAATVTLSYDASLVEQYNAGHDTDYAVLPEEYLVVENATLALPANSMRTEETVKVSLDETADLSALTEKYYLAAFNLTSTGMGASETMGTVYLLVETEINLIRPITSAEDIFGFPADDCAVWTADCADFSNLFDGSSSTSASFDQTGSVVTIDMKTDHMVTGFCLNGSTIAALSIEYSSDGTNWESCGAPTSEEASSTSSSYACAIYDYVEARYLRLSFDFSSWYNPKINELEVYTIESTDPTVYAMTGANNVVNGKITHKLSTGSSTCDLAASFKVYTTIPSSSGYAVTVAVDHSLIAAYNEANGTSYEELPDDNLLLENTTLSIAGEENASSDEVTVSLQGDLSALTAKSGYLVPLKLSTTSPGTVVSASRGVVYVVISTENNIIRGINSPSDMIGFPVEERSSWSADCGNASNLFDGNQSTTVSGLLSSGNVLTVDMQTIHMVTGLHFYSYNLTNLSIEYSTDGTEWNAGGTVASDENHYTGSSWDAGDYYVAIANYVEARYFRFSFGFSTWYTNLYEFEIYQIESTDPMVYAMAGDNNVLNGKITHKAGSSACDLEASFKAYATISSPYGYQVQVTADDSLVETYNNSHGTSYQALPSENLQLENDLLAIAGGENISSGEVKVSLCGNLSALTNANGYLVPLKLSTDSGAAVSDKYGVVYVVLTVENSMIQAIESADEIKGTLVADRSAWSADCDSASSLFDDDEWSWSEFKQTGNVFTVDLSQPVNLTGLYFCGSLFKNLTIEYSADGNTWQSAGTVSDEYVFERESSWDPGYYYVALATSIEARYLRFSFDFDSNEWYYEIYEFNVFQSGN